MILLLAVIVIVMLSYAGLAFVLNLSTENKAAHLQGDQLQLEQVLGSAGEMVRAAAALSWSARREAGGLEDNAELFASVLIDAGDSESPVGQFSVLAAGGSASEPQAVSSPASLPSAGVIADTVGLPGDAGPRGTADATGDVRFGLVDESSRLNLAALAEWDRAAPGAGSAALLNLPGMDEAIADAMLDWIDGDARPRQSGAEADYYRAQGLPYEPRNGVPVSLEELLLIRDVGRSRVFGAEAWSPAEVGESDGPLTSWGNEGPLDGPPWCELLTVWSAERNVTADNEPRVNLNDEDLRRLHSSLRTSLGVEWADFVVAYRQFGPSAEPAEADPQLPSSPRIRPSPAAMSRDRGGSARTRAAESRLDLGTPAAFTVDSVYDLIGARVQLPTESATPAADRTTRSGRGKLAKRALLASEPLASADIPSAAAEAARVIESPLADDPAAIRELLPRVLDRTTVSEQLRIRGRINIYRAPREVLLGVPGLEVAELDRILAVRDTYADSAELSARQLTWLLDEGILDRAQMKALAPYLTAEGDVFRCRLTAVLARGGLRSAAEVAVDATFDPPRQVYWKDLRLLGLGGR